MDSASEQASNGAIRRWSTDDVEVRQRLDYWIGAICEGFLEMGASSSVGAQFEAELVSAPLGPIGVNRTRASAQDVYRSRQAISRSTENYFYLLGTLDEEWSVMQDGRTARLLPGDLVLVDSRRSYEFHFHRLSTTVSLELKPTWTASWLVQPDEQVAQRIDGQRGWGQALSAFVRELSPQTAIHSPLPPALLVDQLGALLALATPHADDRTTSHRTEPRQLVLNAICERHTEAGLTAAVVASGLGVSERSLHRWLASGSKTFANALADCRIAMARRLLADHRFDRLTVAEIGRRAGFADASHFVRQFKLRGGLTPGAMRRQR